MFLLILALLFFTPRTAVASNFLGHPSRRVVASERIDPELLAQLHNISCVGDQYDLELPLQLGWNPNAVTVQKLCAKTEYGGGPPLQNIGGWCDRDEIVFDDSDSAHVNPQLSNPRVHLGCRYRCFCNHDIPIEQRSTQPQPTESQSSLRVRPKGSSQTYEIQLDVINDFTTPRALKRGSRDAQIVPALRKTHLRESKEYEDVFRPRYRYISQDTGNSIHCKGPLPTFTFPPPYQPIDFPTLQTLCAVQLNGGLLGANAGGYCHRSNPNSSTVWFSDEMTPRQDWTWSGPNFFFTASTRMHCALHCRCSSSFQNHRNNDTALDNLWTFLSGAQLAVQPSGQINLQIHSAPPGTRITPAPLTILPAQTGPNSPSGTCGTARNEFCPTPWPTPLLGPIPRAPPDTTDIVRAHDGTSANGNLTTCGNQCEGMRDCGGGDAERACVCAIPSSQDARELGLDPVVPAAVCLVLMRASFGGGWGRRGEETGWRCLCNATFAHRECCGSQDGVVWVG